MEAFEARQQNKKFNPDVKIFSVPFELEVTNENISTSVEKVNNTSRELILNQALKFHSERNIPEAVKHYQYFIDLGFNDYRVYSNYGSILKGIGQLKEAVFLYRKAIEIKPDFAEAFSNLGILLKDLGRLKDAELSFRKAIELKPNFAEAYTNLSNLLIGSREFKEAEMFLRKAIEVHPKFAEAYNSLGKVLIELDQIKDAEKSFIEAIRIKPKYYKPFFNLAVLFMKYGLLQKAEELFYTAIKLKPNYAKSYLYLSLLEYSDHNKILQETLFSESILKNQLKEDKVAIYFARANVLHRNRNYFQSSKCLKIANTLKLEIKPSNITTLINESKSLVLESNQKIIKKNINLPDNIFIVGMPRSGSTLLESIISMNSDVLDLGEVNILEESFIEWKSIRKINLDLSLFELYLNKINSSINKSTITSNKWLYNYLYTGIISSQIPNSKIIHCYRNPLDNILSIYRTNFIHGNQYSSSLSDCAKVYLDHDETMNFYKKKYRSNIYDFNYDLLVTNPREEITALIKWLDWEWNDSYLSPHLSTRPVSTASSVQVRAPINSRSVGSWKNYKEMLSPAVELLLRSEKYKDL